MNPTTGNIWWIPCGKTEYKWRIEEGVVFVQAEITAIKKDQPTRKEKTK